VSFEDLAKGRRGNVVPGVRGLRDPTVARGPSALFCCDFFVLRRSAEGFCSATRVAEVAVSPGLAGSFFD
jgi:hypothetical protein